MTADPNGMLAIIIQSCMDLAVPLGLGLAVTAILITLSHRREP